MSELNQLTLAAARELLRKKDVTSVELTEACLDASGLSAALNAVVYETSEVALAQAKAADNRLAKGEAPSMCGLPIGIKDFLRDHRLGQLAVVCQ